MMMMIMVNGNIEVFETLMIASLFSCCMFPVWREAETIARVAQLRYMLIAVGLSSM